MTDTHVDADETAESPVGRAERRDPLRLALIALIAAAALLGAGAVGWLVRGGPATTSTSSVDAGFARDMSTHHTQAVIMASYTRDTTTDLAVKNLAYDIESAQTGQVGEMTGWLDAWGLTRTSSAPLMEWMGHGDDGMDMGGDMSGMDMGTASSTAAPGDVSLMPGMATPNEVTKLQTLTGRALDVYFLQLMLRHHIAGVEMAQYAATHAAHDYVRNFAQKLVDSQNNEITVMRQMLTDRDAKPL